MENSVANLPLAFLFSILYCDWIYDYKHVEVDEVSSNEKIERPYVALKDKIYLSVRNKSDKFLFAHLNEGEIEFLEKVHLDGKDIYPKKLPYDNGHYREIVGIPDLQAVFVMETKEAGDLLEEIKQHIEEYIVAPESDLEIFSYYILFTWFYQKVNTLPYIRFLGDSGKGKSRFLQVISDICFYPISISAASSGSAMMRLNETWRGTVVIDESDIDGGTENMLIKYLNLGFERGKYITKCKASDYNSFDYFDPYCPKIISMRKPFRDNATEGRLISFTPKEEVVEGAKVNLPPQYAMDVKILRGMIARFVLFNWNKVDASMVQNCDWPDIENRIKQIVLPLSVLCNLLPEKMNLLENFVYKRQNEMKKVRSQSWEGTVFNHVFVLARNEDKIPEGFDEFVGSDGIIRIPPMMVAKSMGSSSRSITENLKGIGMISESSRIELSDGQKATKRYYAVPDESTWKGILKRYWVGNEDIECPEALKSKSYN